MRFALAVSLLAIFNAVVGLPANRVLVSRGACKIGGCLAALGPMAVNCVGAAVKAGADPIADAKCVADVINQSVHIPPDCHPCLDQLHIKDKITHAVQKVEHVFHHGH
ncbi:hypothetical protein LshimejAT787_2100420 [Lyophyllum shimeji]|uniref:Fungal calcium binding protein domain-containing protein n=1 Tax=Lyophyllum shimeji TaxID=47721 RepID=A0A9P3UUL7_LYOSH|nr:hypothetical protein LshimejAT787_2100420 [Lyophyllum shimeji]